jgi:5'-methylthioadenosine phosphorylase
MTTIELGIIGGSGLYKMDELTDIEELQIDTPFGKPSDAIIVGSLHGHRIAFLPRHGRGHRYNPTELPYRANIYALKTLGVKYLIGVSACGSLQKQFAPGHIVIPDQLYDNTTKRHTTFFEDGIVAHVGMADPFTSELCAALSAATKAVGGTVHDGGTFITIEGPRFSTRGESKLFRQWGMSIIGMTTSPEAFLAAEAQMAYACMAHVTDYDVWHETEEDVTVERVIATVHNNVALAQKTISRLAATMDEWAGDYAVHSSLQYAVMTDPKLVKTAVSTKLAPLFK